MFAFEDDNNNVFVTSFGNADAVWKNIDAEFNIDPVPETSVKLEDVELNVTVKFSKPAPATPLFTSYFTKLPVSFPSVIVNTLAPPPPAYAAADKKSAFKSAPS